ncbi:MAG: hypothetical protein J4G05_03550 [Chlorobi bacterium]|nr:hypothetical protein [Chlorobiota bacterium]
MPKNNHLLAILFQGTLVLFVSLIVISCSDNSDGESGEGASTTLSTPIDAYNSLVSAVEAQEFGKMYDLMDSSAKSNWQVFVEVNRAQIDRLDSTEQWKWRNLEGRNDMRGIFAGYVAMTPLMWNHYRGKHQVIKVDTVVVVVARHNDQDVNVEYFRWENGAYHMTRSPEAYAAPTVERIALQQPPASN